MRRSELESFSPPRPVNDSWQRIVRPGIGYLRYRFIRDHGIRDVHFHGSIGTPGADGSMGQADSGCCCCGLQQWGLPLPPGSLWQ